MHETVRANSDTPGLNNLLVMENSQRSAYDNFRGRSFFFSSQNGVFVLGKNAFFGLSYTKASKTARAACITIYVCFQRLQSSWRVDGFFQAPSYELVMRLNQILIPLRFFFSRLLCVFFSFLFKTALRRLNDFASG